MHSRQRRRWIAIAAGTLAAYAALGFGMVPLVIENQLPKLGQSELAHQASVGEVSFNPFTLRLEAVNLRLAQADGAPLFAVGKLAVQLEWRSLIRRAWSFADIRVTAPSVHLAIAPDGRFNLAELLAKIKSSPDAGAAAGGLPRIMVEQFTLEQGKVDLNDRRAGYTNVFAPIDFSLTDFSTLSDQTEAHTFSAQSARGGKLRWKGQASVNPIGGSGELTLEDASLPDVAVYLKSYTRARVAAGRLSATVPYSFSYSDGKLQANLAGARLSLADLALALEGATDSFATLTRLDVTQVDADLVRRQATIGQVQADGGKLAVRRDAKGELDLAHLMAAAAGPAAAPPAGVAVVADDWKLAVKQVLFDQVAISAIDETVSPPIRMDAGNVRLQLQLVAEQAAAGLQLQVTDGALAVTGLALASGAQTPLQLGQLGFTGGTFDLAARRAGVARLYAEAGKLQLVRDQAGRLNVMGMLPRFDASAAPAASPADRAPWTIAATSVELGKINAQVQDEGMGVKVHLDDLTAKLEGAGSDLRQPVRFDASLSVREGGRLSARGSATPGTGAVQADVRVQQLALAPLQPVLARYVKLKIAGGQVSAQGRVTLGAGTAKSAGMRYVGSVDIAGLALHEADGDPFASWKNVGAERLTVSLAPDLLDIPELRVVDANAKLIIEDDRSFNAARLLVKPTGSAPVQSATPAAAEPFPVRVQRIRLQNAKLDFADLSLRPQFGAKIHDLNGVVNGLSSQRDSRSQIELDGRVDEFGLARIRGELNAFVPSQNTDLNVVFKNVDMVTTSPYTIKFAGYRIAEGKISLDLQYKVRANQLAGANQIVIDKLTLGERVDSPDALKLPLELAIAILKDSDGRIDLGLPVSGNLDDPQFSYGALIWKAVGTLLTKIVTAPFRAIGAMLGGGGEKLEVIDFDVGSGKLSPPELEKLKQVAQLLAKRPQLKLSVPGHYSEAVDGAALRARAVRLEIARRAGAKLEAGEEPGPVDFGNRAVRGALRDLYATRFGDAELDKQKKAAEAAVAAPAAAASTPAAPGSLPVWQRVGNMIQGEPQVADSRAFYTQLLERLNQNQPLAADALTQLGAQRAQAIVAALKDAGIDATRAAVAPPEKVSSDAGKQVPVKLALGAR